MSVFTYLKRLAGEQVISDENLSPQEFLERMTEDDLVIDVRMPQEFLERHVKGAVNHNISTRDFREQIDALDRNRTYYLYCRSGNRSGLATKTMRQLGFEKAYNIGGLNSLEYAGVETS